MGYLTIIKVFMGYLTNIKVNYGLPDIKSRLCQLIDTLHLQQNSNRGDNHENIRAQQLRCGRNQAKHFTAIQDNRVPEVFIAIGH